VGSLGCEQAEEALRDLEKFNKETELHAADETADQDKDKQINELIFHIFKRNPGESDSHYFRVFRFQYRYVLIPRELDA